MRRATTSIFTQGTLRTSCNSWRRSYYSSRLTFTESSDSSSKTKHQHQNHNIQGGTQNSNSKGNVGGYTGKQVKDTQSNHGKVGETTGKKQRGKDEPNHNADKNQHKSELQKQDEKFKVGREGETHPPGH